MFSLECRWHEFFFLPRNSWYNKTTQNPAAKPQKILHSIKIRSEKFVSVDEEIFQKYMRFSRGSRANCSFSFTLMRPAHRGWCVRTPHRLTPFGHSQCIRLPCACKFRSIPFVRHENACPTREKNWASIVRWLQMALFHFYCAVVIAVVVVIFTNDFHEFPLHLFFFCSCSFGFIFALPSCHSVHWQ